MTEKWQIRDIINFEYFLAESRESHQGADRRIYLEYLEDRPGLQDRQSVFRYWLKRRKQKSAKEEPTGALPGDIYADAVFSVRLVLAVLAAISGAGLAWSVLSYGGAAPVNIFTCLWILLAPQVLLLIILAASPFFYGRREKRIRTRGLYRVIYGLVLRIAKRAAEYAASKAPQQRKDRLRSALGAAGGTGKIYGRLFFWPVFNTAQAAGISFNLGILAAILLKITITDVAFGWQSTLQPDPETVYRIIAVISMPWAWLADPPVAHPTAAQIEGSRMVLKEGIYHLATGDLAAWWPFLCLCVAFYGLLPRILLMIFGLWRQNRALAGLDFGHSGCERLWSQMTAPTVETASRPYSKQAAEKSGKSPPDYTLPDTGRRPELTEAAVAVPEETDIDLQFISDHVRSRLGLETWRVITVSDDAEEDEKRLAGSLGRNSGHRRLVIIQESWQPPIKENLSWIKRLKRAAGEKTSAVVLLAGKINAENGSAQNPSPEEQAVWQRAVNSLADPYIRAETIGEQACNE